MEKNHKILAFVLITLLLIAICGCENPSHINKSENQKLSMDGVDNYYDFPVDEDGIPQLDIIEVNGIYYNYDGEYNLDENGFADTFVIDIERAEKINVAMANSEPFAKWFIKRSENYSVKETLALCDKRTTDEIFYGASTEIALFEIVPSDSTSEINFSFAYKDSQSSIVRYNLKINIK